MKAAFRLGSLCVWAVLFAPSMIHAALLRKAVAVPLFTDEGGYGSAIIDTVGGTALFGSSVVFVSGVSSFTFITPVTISPFSIASAGTAYFNGVANLSAAAFDVSTRFAYFASSTTPTAVEVVPLGTGAPFSRLVFPTGLNAIGTAVVDSTTHIGYFGTHTSPSVVVKVQLPDGASVLGMSIISTITLPSGLSYLSASVIDTEAGYAYFASSTTTGAVAKIKLANFTLVSTITFNSGEGPVGSAIIDPAGGHAYFGTLNSPGKIVEVQLGSFSRSRVLTLHSGENHLTSAVFDPTRSFGYFGTNTSSGIVVPINFASFSERTSAELLAGENYLRSAVIDAVNGYAYFGTYTTPGKVVQMDLLGGVPEILTQPVSANVHAGVTADFAVIADGRNITYQWQINDEDIPGAKSARYSRVASAGDDGSFIRCILTNAVGSVSTDNVEMTILPIIRVYPNPWRSDRHTGVDVTFDGLLPNTTVKIFNLAARWVKTLPPATGSTTWNRTNDAGQTVASGYYYYLITSRSEKQTVRGTLAIIR